MFERNHSCGKIESLSGIFGNTSIPSSKEKSCKTEKIKIKKIKKKDCGESEKRDEGTMR